MTTKHAGENSRPRCLDPRRDVNPLQNLQRRFGLSYLFIARDLALVKHISDHVAVIYLGKLVEIAASATFRGGPCTQALLAAIPRPDPRVRKKRMLLVGNMPGPFAPRPRLSPPHAAPGR